MTAARSPLSPARSWWAIFVFMIALMFNFLDRQLMTLLITPIKADFQLSDTQISLLIGFAFVLFYVLVGIPISRFVDRGPRKWLLGAALTFWSLMTAACGLAANVWQLIAARMLVGAGESTVICTHRPVLPTVVDALGVPDPSLEPGCMLVVHHRKGKVVATEVHRP